MPRPTATAALAALLVTLAAGTAPAQQQEKCFGVSRAGQNEGVGDAEEPGTATVDFQGDAWTWVPAGRCLTLPLPDQTDGTPRRGSQQSLDRDRP